MNKEKKFATKTVETEPVQGPIMPITTPIYASSTYILENAEHGALLSSRKSAGKRSPWLYSRWGNPTTDVAARIINKLEGGEGTHVTSSGMAAITTSLFAALKSGDHVVAPEPVYGGTHEVFKTLLPSYGIEVSWVDGTDIDQYGKAIKNNTKVLYGETPANPTMSICDLKALGDLGDENNIITMVDSTFASPYNQNPIDLGINVVIHSATKYLGGHSDIIAGSITSDDDAFHKLIFQSLKLFGGILSPYDGYLLSRGIKTLDVRMNRHNENAMKIAHYLKNHQKIETVYYPGLSSHPQHETAKKQMKGFGGMIAFEVTGGLDAGKKIIENVETINLAVSLGGVESLIEHAASMTHTMVSREERLKGGITDGLIRLSVGLENVEDLIDDLDQALMRL